MQALIDKMPLPNDFTTGDGLNTAGIRFVRRMHGYDRAAYLGGGSPDVNRNQFNVRIDHNFNAAHKLSFTASLQEDQTSTDPLASQYGRMDSMGGSLRSRTCIRCLWFRSCPPPW